MTVINYNGDLYTKRNLIFNTPTIILIGPSNNQTPFYFSVFTSV